MNNNILLELINNFNDGYEKTIVYKNGSIVFEKLKENNVTKTEKNITIINELELKLNELIKDNVYDFINNKLEHNPKYKIKYLDYIFNNFDVYMDFFLMIKVNQIKDLSVIEKYKKEEKNKKRNLENNKIIEQLDKMEKEKELLDITNISEINEYNDERKIILFNLEKKNNFEMGESRFFSDTIDILNDIKIPDFLEFVGMLNLNDISKYDINNLLPKDGILYFFQSPLEKAGKYYEFGQVILGSNNNLVRKKLNISDENKDMVLNLSVKNISNTTEKFSDRYEDNEYNSFSGEKINKIYGFYTDCQMSEKDILKASENYIILLQLGTDIYGEGVTTFLIKEEDLKNKNFEKIIYTYVQS